MMAFGLLAVIILFQVILYKFIGGIVNEIFNFGFINMEMFARSRFWSKAKTRLLVCYSLAIFIITPLCSIKTFSQMGFISTIGIFSLFLIIIIIVFQCPLFYYHNIIKKK